MKFSSLVLSAIFTLLLCACKTTAKVANTEVSDPNATIDKASDPGSGELNDPGADVTSTDEDAAVLKPQEKYFRSVRQMTFNGDNAEAYWSNDDSQLVFQATNDDWGVACDQIYVVDADYTQREGEIPEMQSTGNGRTTCAYFLPGDQDIIFASTHGGHEDCPVAPPRVIGGKYVWPIYSEYEIYAKNLSSGKIIQLTDEPGYDAEATVSPDGEKIVFTSLRNGDLDLYTMNIDGSDVKQITTDLGYDGGGFFSPDSKKIVFRAGRPKDVDEANAYKYLLTQNLIEPTDMELYVCDADGSNLKQITNLGGANWAPYWHPSGEKIIFSSNHHSEGGFPFNIFMINVDGTGLEQVSFGKKFDSFPMFSRDGTKLAFSSNRNNGGTRSTNVFIAEWVE